MKPIVFAGPSLGAASHPGIELRAPAACGDLARSVMHGPPPPAIGLVDGLFETTASSWHKEILWVMAQGVPVLGAASTGALRAVELEPFGMVGLGEVFEAYRSGAIEADDEVAVQHGPAETGYVVLSDAMVNLRASLRAARDGGVIDEDARTRLVARAKTLFFKHRTWERVLDGDAVAPALRAWLPSHAIDVKRADALALVERLAAGDFAPPAVPQTPRTLFWDALETRLSRG